MKRLTKWGFLILFAVTAATQAQDEATITVSSRESVTNPGFAPSVTVTDLGGSVKEYDVTLAPDVDAMTILDENYTPTITLKYGPGSWQFTMPSHPGQRVTIRGLSVWSDYHQSLPLPRQVTGTIQ